MSLFDNQLSLFSSSSLSGAADLFWGELEGEDSPLPSPPPFQTVRWSSPRPISASRKPAALRLRGKTAHGITLPPLSSWERSKPNTVMQPPPSRLC